MMASDITAIEMELKVNLPDEYISLALGGILKDPMHDNAKSIICINQSFRNGEFGDKDWPKELIAFGHEGAGNYFCINCANVNDGVFLRDHETLTVDKVYDTLAQCINEIQY